MRHVAARSAVRLAHDAPQPRRHRGGDRGARARHRRQHRHLQRRRRRAAAAAAVSRAVGAGARLRRLQRHRLDAALALSYPEFKDVRDAHAHARQRRRLRRRRHATFGRGGPAERVRALLVTRRSSRRSACSRSSAATFCPRRTLAATIRSCSSTRRCGSRASAATRDVSARRVSLDGEPFASSASCRAASRFDAAATSTCRCRRRSTSTDAARLASGSDWSRAVQPGVTAAQARRRSRRALGAAAPELPRQLHARRCAGSSRRPLRRRPSSATCGRCSSCCSAPSASCCSSPAPTSPTCCWRAPRRGTRDGGAHSRSAPRAAGSSASCSPRALLLGAGRRRARARASPLWGVDAAGRRQRRRPAARRRHSRSTRACSASPRRLARHRRRSSASCRRCARRAPTSHGALKDGARGTAAAHGRAAQARSSSPRWRCRWCCSSAPA